MALCARIHLHTVGQNVCTKYTMQDIAGGFRGGALHAHTSAHPKPNKPFLDTWDGCEMQATKRHCAQYTHASAHLKPEKRFWIPRVGVFQMWHTRKRKELQGGALYARASAHHRPEKLFLNTWDGCVFIDRMSKDTRGFQITLHAHINIWHT